MSLFEWAVVAFIVASILFHIWRGGARNPESTGALGGKLNKLSQDLAEVGTRVGQVEKKMEEIERDSASVKDIQRIEERIETVYAVINGHKELSAATNRSVERIEKILIEQALGK